jgi:multidrug transporter EmrE-like cation transporter
MNEEKNEMVIFKFNNIDKFPISMKFLIIIFGILEGLVAITTKLWMNVNDIGSFMLFNVIQIALSSTIFLVVYPNTKISIAQNLLYGIAHLTIYVLSFLILYETFDIFKILGISLIILAVILL